MKIESDFFPKRIVCLTEEPTEVLYLLGEQSRIVGISGYTVRPAIARQEKPMVSAFISARIDKIIDLKPDLVIGFSDIQADIARDLIKNGISVLIWNHRSVDEIFKMIVRLGSLVGKYDEALALTKVISENMKRLAANNLNQKHKPRIYFEEWDEPMISGIQWVSELISLAGGIDVFSDRQPASLAKDRIIENPQEIVRANPDIILASWCGKPFDKEKLINRPGWNAINAVRNNFIYEIPSETILQPGPASLTDGFKDIVDVIESWQKHFFKNHIN